MAAVGGAGEERPDRFAAALAAIDAANAEDPTRVVVRGEEGPKELLHARLMTERVLQLDPDADELQLLAARAHHLRRWASPRDAFPEGRAGYLRWRTAARHRQAAEVARLLAEHGYGDQESARVAAIVDKQGLARDPAVQTHEDALCLVFLETQLADVTGRLGEDHTVEVLTRTLAKMSQSGRTAALEMDLPPGSRRLLERALGRADARLDPAPPDGPVA